MGCGSSVARSSEAKRTVSGPASTRPPETTAPPPAPAAAAPQTPTKPTRPPSATSTSDPPAPPSPARSPSRPPQSGAASRSSSAGKAPTAAASPPAARSPPDDTPLDTTEPQQQQRDAPAPAPARAQSQSQPQPQDCARDLTSILAERLAEQQRQERQERERQELERQEREQREALQRQRSSELAVAPRQPSRQQVQQSLKRRTASGMSGGGGGGSGAGAGGGVGEELAALLAMGSSAERFQDLMRDLMASHTQVLLPGDVNPEDATTLQAMSGCTADQAVRLLDCLAVVHAVAEALAPPPELGSAAAAVEPAAAAAADSAATEQGPADGAAAAAEGAAEGAAAPGRASDAPGGAASPRGPGLSPSPQQLTRQLGALAGLVNDFPGLRTAAMARDAASSLLRVLLRHPERAAAANAALALAALAAGPPPHKASLIAAGVVDGLLQAARGRTAAAEANGGDAPVVAANACSALGNLATGHAAGAAAVAAGGTAAAAAGGGGGAGGVDTLLSLLAVDNAPNVRTNAAGVLVQLTGAHESHRAAVAAAGGVAALAAGMLRGPDAPACNAVTALYNLAALSPPSLRPAMAQATGQFAIVPQLLLCMSGRNAAGAADESVAASASARVNASAVLLELCKDPRAAPALAEPTLTAPAALAALAAGRLPPPPPPSAAATDILAGGVDILYPVPPVVRGNCLLCLMALARMGAAMQLELGRCGALGTLLELLTPGQDPAMQVNSANAICSLAAANADIHSALVAAHCVPLLAGLLSKGGDAARANVAAVIVTMMRDEDARQQMQECGAIASLVRLAAALLDERLASGISGGGSGGGAGGAGGASSADPGGVLCNTVGALAEAAKHPDLRRALMQVEFGESLVTLLRCLKEAPEPAQVNAAAALCHLCREQSAAVQLGRLRGVELIKEAVGAHPDDGAPPGSVSWTRPSSRLRHNASRALARLQEQLAAAEEEEQAAAAARAVGRAAAAAAAAAGDEATAPPVTALSGSIHVNAGDGDDAAAARGGGGSGRREPLRAVWDLADGAAAAGAAGAPPASSSRVFDEVMSYGDADDSDVDDLSTVITPPLPLAAF
ncbi:hypothetical protein PLESTB_000757200 [Pleodorina starrii]|uniref:Uncharacterized protein n=1 Tax=Pleodorina starrii TaxID=330485 RepID=A0A9W6BK68_9CHLO|nr:hypothetical protein PLESTM_001573200 [Pleodorina starrii]GLC53508.1 hypothetical protein PLESTB_000757200 [Pleodorina starrii]GLC65794.1 hypothetical protein PLESTF_000340700 [Pleodorina starrii]